MGEALMTRRGGVGGGKVYKKVYTETLSFSEDSPLTIDCGFKPKQIYITMPYALSYSTRNIMVYVVDFENSLEFIRYKASDGVEYDSAKLEADADSSTLYVIVATRTETGVILSSTASSFTFNNPTVVLVG